MPRPISHVLLLLAALSLVPLGLVYKSRQSTKSRPRIQVVYDMDKQSYYKAQSANAFFADGMSMRGYAEGTVARGQLNESDAYYRGVERDTVFVDTFPLTVDEALLLRGQERFNIYCAPCHGQGGDGNGMVHKRAAALAEGTWTPPTDLTGQTVVDRPVGHIYNTISRGIRNMPSYGAQIEPRDRWAIVAHLRALQRSRKTAPGNPPALVQAVPEQAPVTSGTAIGD